MKSRTLGVPHDFYKLVFDNMINGLAHCQMIFDKQGQPVDFIYLEVNKSFENLTGLKNVVGKKVTKMIPGIMDSNPELIKTYGRVSLTGKPEQFETYMPSLKMWFFISVFSPRKNFFVAIFQNTTDQKLINQDLEKAKIAARNVLEDLQVEKENLSRAKAKDEAMLSSIGDGVIIIDPKEKITLINQPALDLLQLDRAEIMGKLLFDIFPIENEKGERVSKNDRPMAVALENRTTTTTTTTTEEGKAPNETVIKPKTGIYYYMRKDKTKFPVFVSVAPVIFENNIIGAIEIFRDITKEMEIDREKSEFVSLASHQLKTPPTAIKLLTERLLNNRVGTFNPLQKEYIDNIRSSNQRMIDLINSLLSVSRIELGKFSIEPFEKDVCLIVKNTIKPLASITKKKKIQLKEVYFQESFMMPVDEILFHIVINNLIMNALYYTLPNGTVQVECKEIKKGEIFGSVSLKEDYFAVIVSDTGCGIPENQQSKIFTKFFRADNARILRTDGTGLGLYIVKSILDNSGGLIWFSSQENKGTTFYVAFPVAGMKAKEGTTQLI